MYDFSMLPGNHRIRNWRLSLAAVLLLAVLLGSIVLHPGLAVTVMQLLVVAGLVSLGGCLLVAIYLDNRAFTRFIQKNNLTEVSEEDMWTVVPLCFAGLKDNPDLVDASVSDGYTFELASGINCVLFNFSYILQSGKNRRTYTFAVAAILEQRIFPHLFLDGKQNGASFAYEKSQHLSLEGDFDNYFNLYVPDGEATDALVLVTPDIMQTLVDGGRPYDLELMDDAVSVIARGSQYTKEKLPVLLHFLSALDLELSQKPAGWSNVDVAAALSSELKSRKVYDPLYLFWVMVALVAILALWSVLN